MKFKLSEYDVEVLSKVADLSPQKQRNKTLLSPLSDWIESANNLNRKMSDSKFSHISPISTFKHPEDNHDNSDDL